ncbi:MAG: HdeD family acid-resistance protein [Acidimicrobiia bacterium]
MADVEIYGMEGDDEAAAAVGRHWWVFALTGLGVLIFGILVLALPRTLLVIAVVVGLGMIFFGILEVVHGFVMRSLPMWWLYSLRGAVSTVFGIVLVAWPDRTAEVIAVLVGIYLILAGLFQFLMVLAVPDADDRGLYILLAIIAVILGIFVLRDPDRSLRIVALIVGAWFVFFGMLEIVSAFGIRALGRESSDSSPDGT